MITCPSLIASTPELIRLWDNSISQLKRKINFLITETGNGK